MQFPEPVGPLQRTSFRTHPLPNPITAFHRWLLMASKELVSISHPPWWLVIIVALGAALMAAGALIALLHPAMLVSPRDQINGAVRVYAGYLVSRNLTLAIMLLVALSRNAREQLRILVILTAFIQLLDAGLDGMEGRWTLVPGVLLFAIAFFVASAWLSRRPTAGQTVGP
jgi:hypothetical protein